MNKLEYTKDDLIESFVEIMDTPLNKQVNQLDNKLDAQDKIINNQALEIARLKEDKETLVLTVKTILKEKEELEQKIDKAIDLAKIKIESCNAGLSNAETSIISKHSLLRLEIQSYKELLEILGEKENE